MVNQTKRIVAAKKAGKRRKGRVKRK